MFDLVHHKELWDCRMPAKITGLIAGQYLNYGVGIKVMGKYTNSILEVKSLQDSNKCEVVC